MTIAGAVLIPFAIKSFRQLKSFKDLIFLSIVGFSGNFFPSFLFTYAETGLSSGYTGMLNSFTPIFALIIGIAIFKSRLSKIQLIGLIIGTIGIILLSLSGQDLSLTGGPQHVLAVVIATFCYGISMNTIKFKLSHYKGLDITAMAFSVIFIPSLIITFFTGSFNVINENPNGLEGLLYIAILSVIGTALAVFLFSILIARSSILFSSSVTYLIPIFAALIGIGYGETITSFQVISMIVVLSGVFTANALPGKLKSKN